jgi:hypothetical protein
VTCGIDKGSSVTGLACVGNATVLLAAEIRHRRDVKEKMDGRRDRGKMWDKTMIFSKKPYLGY